MPEPTISIRGKPEYLAVMAGGAAGVGVRMLISNWIANHFGLAFPWGTQIVNVSDCLIIGLFTGIINLLTEGEFLYGLGNIS